MDETGPEPARPKGVCPHGRVQTLCPDCRARIPTAPPAVHRAPPRSVPRRASPPITAAEARLLRAPEPRGRCARCSTEAPARDLVQDVEFRQYLCRPHGRDVQFERVIFERAGRHAELQDPTPEAWRDLLDEAEVLRIRVYRGRGKPSTRPNA